jgi:hypothetical protein
MLRDPDYRSRLAEEFPDGALLREPERTLFGALSRLPAETPPSTLFEGLEGEPSVLLHALLQEEAAPPDLAAVVVGAIGAVRSRPLVRELESVKRQLGLASEDEKVTLARRVTALRQEIHRLRSGRWNVITTRRSSAG